MASPSAPMSAAELKKALLADPKASTNEGQAKAKAKAKDKKKVNPVAKQMLERRQKKIKAQEAMKGVAVPKPAVVDEAKVEEAQAQLLRMLEEEEVRRQAREEKRRDRRKKGKERKKGAGQAQEDEDLKEAADDEFDPQEAQKLEKIITGGCSTEAVGMGDTRMGGGLLEQSDDEKGDEQPINNMQARTLAGVVNAEDMVNNGGAGDQRAQSEEEERGVAEGEDGYEDAEEGEEAGVAWIVIHPDFLMCPISMALMTDPVLAADGFTYQREAIEAWIHKCKNEKKAVRSPSTNEPLGSLDLHSNLAFRSIVYAHLNARRNNLPVVT